MKEKVMDAKQSNKYDKVFKENEEDILPVVLKEMLHLSIVDSIEIPDSIQYTKERKPDVLKMVTDNNNEQFILHIEWQTHNEKYMVYRMAEYSIMLQRKYKMRVEQYVIFIGEDDVTMITKIDHKNFKFDYNIKTLRDFDYKLFLRTDNPAIKVFAILANFGEDDVGSALRNIVEEVKRSVGGKLEEGRYLNQLHVLVKLCNEIVNLKFNEMISLDEIIKEEEDVFFIRGKEIGKEEGIEEGIKEGIKKGKVETVMKMKEHGLNPSLIAEITNIPIEEIVCI
jgi:predicted transposase/invertase (TIGR01784 family)